jgi:hypothetical protein
MICPMSRESFLQFTKRAIGKPLRGKTKAVTSPRTPKDANNGVDRSKAPNVQRAIGLAAQVRVPREWGRDSLRIVGYKAR